MKKPNIEDYGISEEEYLRFENYMTSKQKIEDKSLFISCILFVIQMMIGIIVVEISVIIMLKYSWHLDVDFSITNLKGIDIVCCILMAYPYCKLRRNRQLKKCFKLISNISAKHVERLEDYYNDVLEYRQSIEDKQNYQQFKKTKIQNAKDMIAKVNNVDFNTLTTEDLKKCMWDLYENNLQEEAESLFDFSLISSNVNIVCFGIDDNISKIEIKQFLDYVKEYNEKIFIYSINEIDNKSLTNNSRIKIINSEKLKKSFLDKYNDEIKNV